MKVMNRYDRLKQSIKENRESFWHNEKERMFNSGHEVFFYRGKEVSKEEAEKRFDDYIKIVLTQ
jgi:hypothetical protein